MDIINLSTKDMKTLVFLSKKAYNTNVQSIYG